MERIAMTQEERDWLEWLKRARDGVITQRKVAEKMGVTERWVHELLRGMAERGDAVVVHGLGPAVESRHSERYRAAGHRGSEGSRMARLRPDVRKRATGEAARHRGEQRNG